jgi:hypothetical protein
MIEEEVTQYCYNILKKELRIITRLEALIQ